MKKIISMILVLAMCCGMLATTAFAVEADTAAVELSVSNKAACTGETVTVDVVIANNPGAVAVTFNVDYDAEALELVDVTSKAFDYLTKNLNTGYVSLASAAANNANGAVATLTFKVLAEGSSEVTLKNVNVYDASYKAVDATVKAGTVAFGHVYGEASCTEPAKCELCGEAKEGSVALGHGDYTVVYVSAPTCTEDAVLDITCNGCGEKVPAEEWKTWENIVGWEAKGHDYGDASCTDPATCTRCGETTGEALGHTWVDADCDTAKTCSVCGVTEGEALGHTWVDADCDTAKTCSVCGATEGEALGHTWVDADCDTAKTCSVCGATEGEALGHTWVPADCDTAKTCSVCGATEGEALGHTWADADCDTPKTCSVCGATEGEALGHKWVDADCDTAKTCSVCGLTEGEALGHKWVDATTEAPKTCTVCGATEGEPVPPAGDNTFLFIIAAMMMMAGASVLVFKKKYF